jgi:hypothetical protein
MRVTALTASFVLGAALISTTGLMTTPARAGAAKVTCLCDCPADHKVAAPHAAVRPVPRRVARRVVRRYAQSGGYFYSYGSAAPVYQREWHGQWRQVPNDAYLPGPAPVAYYAPPAYAEPQGLAIDQRGWSGGVGNEEGGGGGGGGTGQILLTNGANSQNGPSYNSYGESFQQNPSVPGPFQNRLMGGLAPASSSSSSGSK